ncbi:related to tol protein [Fusarium fujikuroi]|nr:related to tol protein [Fusarium fujikuroi]SCV59478.1 related to tol protein [Fusarium fujikuroi]
MAASDNSPYQFAKLCKRCACLQLRSTTLDDIQPRNPSVGERSQEQEVDLDWNVTNYLSIAFHPGGDKCDACEFLRRVVKWWRVYDESVRALELKRVPVSLHYVFTLGEADQYGLKALRIRLRPDGKEFHIDCPVTAATDLDMGTPLRLQPHLSHINEESILWMKSKLESCVSHNHFNSNKTFIPDRLLDVRENRLSLVLTKDWQPRGAEIHRYVALTYCWGPEPHARKQLKTTRDNISQHQRQIPEFSLPQVIKDAVSVTRALSVPFLWVDALCILQDDVSDWENQCAVMERIYGNAYAAVAATFSDNCEQGFLKKTERILVPFRTHLNDTYAFAIYSPPHLINDANEVSDSPWARRGWTFQERISSTRILMFSKGDIYVKCKYFNESTGGHRVTHEEYYIMLDRVTIDSGSTAANYQEWSDIIAQIHPRRHQLTRKTDFLPSIAGIASLFSKRLNDDYAAGLWKNNMHQSLCWAAGEEDKPSHQDLLQRLRAPSPYIAPSWSWASRREDFLFLLYRPDLSGGCRPEFHSLDTAIALRGESAFGEVRHAALDITSRVHVGSPRLALQKLIRLSGEPDTIAFDGRYFADIHPDCFVQSFFGRTEGFALQAPISFLLIGSTIPHETDTGDISPRYPKSSKNVNDEADAGVVSEVPNTSSTSAERGAGLETETRSKRLAYGLLIHPTGNPNEYYRVGTFFSKPHSAGGLSFFDNVEVRTVRLV